MITIKRDKSYCNFCHSEVDKVKKAGDDSLYCPFCGSVDIEFYEFED